MLGVLGDQVASKADFVPILERFGVDFGLIFGRFVIDFGLALIDFLDAWLIFYMSF